MGTTDSKTETSTNIDFSKEFISKKTNTNIGRCICNNLYAITAYINGKRKDGNLWHLYNVQNAEKIFPISHLNAYIAMIQNMIDTLRKKK